MFYSISDSRSAQPAHDTSRTVHIDGITFVEEDDSQEQQNADDDNIWWMGGADDAILPDALSSGHINDAEFRAGECIT